MFNLQPGTGLGFTGSRQIAFALGGTVVVPTITDPDPTTYGRFYEEFVHQEDEEILLIARAFVEVIRWH